MPTGVDHRSNKLVLVYVVVRTRAAQHLRGRRIGGVIMLNVYQKMGRSLLNSTCTWHVPAVHTACASASIFIVEVPMYSLLQGCRRVRLTNRNKRISLSPCSRVGAYWASVFLPDVNDKFSLQVCTTLAYPVKQMSSENLWVTCTPLSICSLLPLTLPRIRN